MKKSSVYLFLIFCPALIFIGACKSSKSVSKNAPERVNYNQYSSFDFGKAYVLSSSNPAFSWAQFTERIQQEIAFDLPAKGLDRDQTNPDLKIFFYAVTHPGQNPPVLPYHIGWAAEPFLSHGEHFDRYPSDTFVLDFVDTHTNELVWRGSIQLPFGNQKKLYTTFQEQIHSLIQHYPLLP